MKSLSKKEKLLLKLLGISLGACALIIVLAAKLPQINELQTQIEQSEQMIANIPEESYTIFKPETGGIHGAKALWSDNPSKDEYWLALLLFINNLNK